MTFEEKLEMGQKYKAFHYQLAGKKIK